MTPHRLSPGRGALLVAAGIVVCVAGIAVLLQRRAQEREREAAVARAEVEQRLVPQRLAWRGEQDREMRGELSPLARVNYIHLQEGAASPVSGIVFHLRGGELLLSGHGAKVNGKQVEGGALHNGDVVAVETYRLLVAGLPGNPALAIYDLDAPPRRDFHGLLYFPDDPRAVALATLERAAPRQVQVEASRGGPQDMVSIGTLRFELSGVACSMEAFREGGGGDGSGPERLFLLFKDKTNGQPDGSYGAGRFLHAQVWPGDHVLLDFNQAWNPLCAYSKFFHCPLPPRQNWLPVAIPAGEKAYPHPLPH